MISIIVTYSDGLLGKFEVDPKIKLVELSNLVSLQGKVVKSIEVVK